MFSLLPLSLSLSLSLRSGSRVHLFFFNMHRWPTNCLYSPRNPLFGRMQRAQRCTGFLVVVCGMIALCIAAVVGILADPCVCPRDEAFIVSITSIPSRLALCKPVIDSFFAGTCKPTCVVVNIPLEYSARFAQEHVVIPDFMQHDPRIVVNRTRKDYGPATKLLGLLDWEGLKPDTRVLVTDDDGRKRPTWACTLLKYLRQHPDSVVTLHPRDIFGGRGFAFRASTLRLVDVAASLEAHPACRLVDDDFLTHYCRETGIPIQHVPFPRMHIHEETSEFRDKLRELRGEQHRDQLRLECRASLQRGLF